MLFLKCSQLSVSDLGESRAIPLQLSNPKPEELKIPSLQSKNVKAHPCT